MVGVAVTLDDERAHVEVELLTHRCELALELSWPHTVARTEHRGLTNEALLRRNLFVRYAPDRARHVLVNVLVVLKHRQDVVLSSQPSQYTCLDLGRVTVDDDMPAWCNQAPL